MGVKSFIAIVALTQFFASDSVYAQQPMRHRSPQEKADRQMQWMDRNLGLTEEQRGKVYDILLYYARQQNQANHEVPPGPEKQDQKRALRHDENGELRSVLTGQQFAMYKEHLQQMKGRRMDRGGDMPPPQGSY